MHKINHANIKEWAKNYDGPQFDGILCDPPYELGFMGKSWDSSGIAFDTDMWADILKLLKPGAHLLAFSGSRTYHRMASAIEDAGFEVRDMIEWVYSTGFPKSLNLNKALQKKCTCGNMEVYDKQRTQQNTKHNMRPVSESDLSQKINFTKEQGEVLQSELSEQSVSISGETTSNVRREESSVERGSNTKKTEGELQGSNLPEMSNGVSADGEEGRLHNATQISDGSTPEQATNENGSSASYRPQSEQQQDRKPCTFCEQLGTQETRRLYEETYGVGSALKPAHEPICLARKPLSEKTLVDNFIKYGTGGINIDESRVGTEQTITRGRSSGGTYDIGLNNPDFTQTNTGRFPANLIHDGSDEVEAVFPQTGKTSMPGTVIRRKKFTGSDRLGQLKNAPINGEPEVAYGDSGSASRFFYTAKASKSERNAGLEGLPLIHPGEVTGRKPGSAGAKNGGYAGMTETPRQNVHPTVKPLSLTKYLATLIKPPTGGRLLVPFSGSGSEMIGALQAGWEYVEGVELTEEYIPIAEARIKYWQNISHKANPKPKSARKAEDIQNATESLTLF